MPSSKTVVAVAGGIAVLGFTGFFLLKRSKMSVAEEDDIAFEGPFVANQEANLVDNTASEVNNVNRITTKTTEEVTKKMEKNDRNDKLADIANVSNLFPEDNKLLAEALNEIEMAELSEPHAKKLVPSSKTNISNGGGGNKKHFPLFGLSVSLPKNWEIREEPSPVPNAAMLVVWNSTLVSENAEQHQNQQMPILIFSVEDIRGDNMDLSEFKERTKELAVNQMLMMTGGAIQPRVVKDHTVQEGPFRHTFEYVQGIPPFYEVAVTNLIEVRDGVAYTFQMTCPLTLMSKYKPTFMEMARSMCIKKVSTALGHVELRTGNVKINIDSMWTWENPGKHGALATFTTTSACRKEEIFFYEQDAVPPSTYKERNEKKVNGVEIVTTYDGNQQEKTFTYNGYTLLVKPLQKPTSYLPEEDLISAIKSVTPCGVTGKLQSGATFVNREHGYQIDVKHGSRIVASRVGGGTVAYAPFGVCENPDDGNQPPAVTIRIGTPENDPECMGSLDEWEARMREEAMESDINDIKRITINNEPCLTFVTNSFEDIAPGKRIKVCGKVFVFSHDGKTTLIRWEIIGGYWKKYEQEMNDFLRSFKFI